MVRQKQSYQRCYEGLKLVVGIWASLGGSKTHSHCIGLLNGRHNAGSITVVHDLDCSTESRIPLIDQH